MCANDDYAIEEIEGKAMRTAVVGAADARISSVAGHDDNGRQFVLERPVDEGKALDVEHVDFVNEQHAGYDFCLAFFLPLCYLGVDLISNLASDLTSISRE